MSQFVVVVQDLRQAATVTSDIEPMGVASDLNAAISHNQGDAWAYARQLSSYFAAVADGAVSANMTILDATTSATATITVTANPAPTNTLTIGGVVITFVSGTPTGSQVQIGVTIGDTIMNLMTFINVGGSAQNLAGIAIARRSPGAIINLFSTLPGTAGNSTTLATTAAGFTLSGSTFTGGLAVTSQTVISAGY